MQDKVAYWLELCDDDLLTAKWLLAGGRLLHCGYFCHQIVEKAFKAFITNKTGEIPPKIHDLSKLASIGNIVGFLSDDQCQIIKKLEPLQIEARYPEYKERISCTLTAEFCSKLLEETEEMLCWIKQQLEK